MLNIGRVSGSKRRFGWLMPFAVLLLSIGCGSSGPSLESLSRNAMATPELSFVEPVSVIESTGTERGENFLSEPVRVTTFFEVAPSQRDDAVEELLEQAQESGFDPLNALPESDWPLAKYVATNDDGLMLSITVSETNLGVELR